MMIPSIAAPAVPALDAGKTPADGFEQAMAAALGIVPVQAQAVIEGVAIGATPGEVASTVDAVPPTVLPAGLPTGLPIVPPAGHPAGPGAGADGDPTPPQPAAGTPTDAEAMPNPAKATDTSRPTAAVAPASMHPAITVDANGESIATATADEPVAGTTAPPHSSLESIDVARGGEDAPDGVGRTRAAEMAVAFFNPVATPPNRLTTMGQGADHAAITAQGLGLGRIRNVGPVTDATEGTAGGVTAALESTSPPPAGDTTTSGPQVGDQHVTKTLPIDRFRPMPEHTGPGTDGTTEARFIAGTERTSRPQAADRRPIQPDLLALDPIAGGADQVAAHSARPGAEVDSGTNVPPAMLQRVEDVVRRLENAPPPRSITLTMDDQGLTRVTVSMLPDGVRLSVPEGSQTPTGLVQDLEQALSNRGFELSRDREQRERPRPDRDDAPAPRGTRHPRHTVPDAGIRL